MRPFGKFNRASEDCTAALLWCFTIQPGEKVQLWFENTFLTWQALNVGIHWSGNAEKLNRMKLCSAARCKTKAFLKLPKCCCSLEVNFGKAQKRIFKRGLVWRRKKALFFLTSSKKNSNRKRSLHTCSSKRGSEVQTSGKASTLQEAPWKQGQ